MYEIEVEFDEICVQFPSMCSWKTDLPFFSLFLSFIVKKNNVSI